MLKRINQILAWPLLLLVRLYQATLSPDHGLLRAKYPDGYCRYYPSCSVYAKKGLKRDGLLSLPKIAWRVARCQPWSLGGVDDYQTILNHKH